MSVQNSFELLPSRNVSSIQSASTRSTESMNTLLSEAGPRQRAAAIGSHGATSLSQHVNTHSSQRQTSTINTSTSEPPLGRMDRYRQLSTDHWLFEISAWLVSVASLAAIVVVLSFGANRPLSTWPFLASINTLVSVFSAIMKAALLVPVAAVVGQSKWRWFKVKPRPLKDIEIYDESSRGPWGSFILLLSIRWWYVKIRKLCLPSLG